MRAPAIILLAALAGATVPALGQTEEADLRSFRIGMAADELPTEGYAGFSCVTGDSVQGTTGDSVQGWQDYRRCPAGDDGLHALRFRYQEGANELGFINDSYEGTKVGGHPVLLTLLISDAGIVEGLRIQTDPAARLNRRKKAYLLGNLAKQRYGETGWACIETPPSPGEEPVGGLFVHERCEKTTATRRYTISRQMFRPAKADQRGFVSESQLQIRGPG